MSMSSQVVRYRSKKRQKKGVPKIVVSKSNKPCFTNTGKIPPRTGDTHSNFVITKVCFQNCKQMGAGETTPSGSHLHHTSMRLAVGDACHPSDFENSPY